MEQTYPAMPAILVSVGGAPASAIHTLNEQKPRFICFFVSPETKSAIFDKILPALTYKPDHFDWILTNAPQNLLECYRVLRDQLPQILDKWEISPVDLGVEYTGGTKPMSVAAVLVTIDTSSRFFYVGASDRSGRDKDGVGVVLDGREMTWYEVNPWEVLAVNLRKEIALLFNHGRFTDARERAERLSQVAEPAMRPIYQALAQLIEGYGEWDRFAYKDAQMTLGKVLRVLEPFAAGSDDPLRFVLGDVEKHIQFLGRLNKHDADAARLDMLDLLANAERRASSAGRYDDAVARLYSALEGLARTRLLNYKIIASKARPEQVPERIRPEFVIKFGDPASPAEPLPIGLEGCYLLLAELGDPLGLKYLKNRDELNEVLLTRNQSRLAHGTIPVKPETYQQMKAILYDFAEVQEDELPVFPTMRL